MKKKNSKRVKKKVCSRRKVKYDDVNVGDLLEYNDCKEKVKLKVVKQNKRRGDGYDVEFKFGKNKGLTILLPSNFKAGHVKRITCRVPKTKK